MGVGFSLTLHLNQNLIIIGVRGVCVGGWGMGWGWLDEAKVSYILRHRAVQLILAYIWARPAILTTGKGRWGIVL